MYRGPTDHICPECGANNSISGYIESYDCYACGKQVTFKEGIKKYLKERFPEGAAAPVVKDKDKDYEEGIFNSLNLSEADRKYISIRSYKRDIYKVLSGADRKHISMRRDKVYISFPLRIGMNVCVGSKRLRMDVRDEGAIYKKVGEFFGDELYKGGFQTGRLTEQMGEIDFYKDIGSDNETKEAVKWLIEFKKRFGF